MKYFKYKGESEPCTTYDKIYQVTKLDGERIYFINDNGDEDHFISVNENMQESTEEEFKKQ